VKGLGCVTERDLDRLKWSVVVSCAVAGRSYEEVEQSWLLAGSSDEHVAAGAGAGQKRLTDP
jgi:hypothetical protein